MMKSFLSTVAIFMCVAGPVRAQAPPPLPAAEVAKIKADVTAAAHEYLRLFSAQDAKGVSTKAYAQPALSLSTTGVSLIDPATQMAGLEQTFKRIVSEGWIKSVFVNPSVCVLNANAALMTSRFQRFDKSDQVIFEGAETALYAKTSEGWKMVGLFGHGLDKTITCSD